MNGYCVRGRCYCTLGWSGDACNLRTPIIGDGEISNGEGEGYPDGPTWNTGGTSQPLDGEDFGPSDFFHN